MSGWLHYSLTKPKHKIMKHYLLPLCLILHLIAFADEDMKKLLERVSFTSIPFDCVKSIDYPSPAFGFSYGTDQHFSLEVYDDLGLTQKAAVPSINYAIFRKFELQRKEYTLVAINMDIAESTKKVLVTYRDGKFIDYIESEVAWWNEKMVFIKQWRIASNEEIVITWLKVQSTPPISAFSDFKSINAQRIDMHYKIDDNGKFELIKEIKYKPQLYPKTYLTDRSKNLWEGDEAPVEEK